MATVSGREQVKAYLRTLPEQIERRLLRGAGKAAAEVLADEARLQVRSAEVRQNITTSVRKRDDKIVSRIAVKGRWENSLAVWLEYGTAGHFISVDTRASGGRTASRVNRQDREAAENGRSGPGSTLVINGTPVGATVWHKGARAHPFMRTALDAKRADAVAAAQNYINSRITKAGIVAGDDE